MLLWEERGVRLLADDEQAEVPPAHPLQLVDDGARKLIANDSLRRADLDYRERRLVVAKLKKELLPQVRHARAQLGLRRLGIVGSRRRGGVYLKTRMHHNARIDVYEDVSGTGERKTASADVAKSPKGVHHYVRPPAASPREERRVKKAVGPQKAIRDFAVVAKQEEMGELALPDRQPPKEERNGM